MKIRKALKTKKNKGFTLIETIAAMIVVVLISIVMVQGITSAISVYDRSTFISESQTLTSTINTEISDILRYAKFDYNDASGNPRFTNYNYSIEKGTFTLVHGRIKIVPKDKDITPDKYTDLLAENTYSTLNIENFKLSYKDGVFSGSYKMSSSKIKVDAKTYTFYFKTLND